MQFQGRGILLDIEGTTSSIQFVYEVMFPYARRAMNEFISEQWQSSGLRQVIRQLADDAGDDESGIGAADASVTPATVTQHVLDLMDRDAKTTGLKALQGLIWQSGFEQGKLISHLFPDVPPALDSWNRAGLDVRVYSSGSVHAQHLFFGHTEFGDLLPMFQGHYDTVTGPKQEPGSYRKITAAYGLPAADILFLSDVPAELDAARAIGMQTALTQRPGNPDTASDHPTVCSFGEIEIGVSR